MQCLEETTTPIENLSLYHLHNIFHTSSCMVSHTVWFFIFAITTLLNLPCVPYLLYTSLCVVSLSNIDIIRSYPFVGRPMTSLTMLMSTGYGFSS
jgi:hypothetical protein